MFFIQLYGELELACKCSVGGNSYYCYHDFCLLYLILSGNNEPFRVTPSTSTGQYRQSVSGEPVLTIASFCFFIFLFFCVHLFACVSQSVCLSVCLQYISNFREFVAMRFIVTLIQTMEQISIYMWSSLQSQNPNKFKLLYQNIQEFFQILEDVANNARVLVKTASSATIIVYLVYRVMW